jgi:hypothetical protein
MVRFGQHDSPVLMEAAGDLLFSHQQGGDAKQLAARAYLRASYEAGDEAAKAAYRRLAGQVLKMQTVHPNTTTEMTLTQLEKAFQQELKEARQWYAQLQSDELKWIESGADVDAEFARKYYQDPVVAGSTPALAAHDAPALARVSPLIWIALGGVAAGGAAWITLVVVRLRLKSGQA